MESLPADLSRDDHRRLDQLSHLEHMAMMVMPAAEQMAFFHAEPDQRAAAVEKWMPAMMQHWPNLEKKHGGEHQHH